MQIRAYRKAAAATFLPRGKVEGVINDDDDNNDFPSGRFTRNHIIRSSRYVKIN